MAKKSRLGHGLESTQGLDAIFGENLSDLIEDIQKGKVETGSGKVELMVDEIKPNPYQPRKQFDEKSLQELADSIEIHGVFTPILVKKAIQGYELVAGERRLRASKLAHKTTIPAIIVDFDDEAMMEIALLENVQREDLNAIEEAQGYQKIIEKLGMTQEQLAKRIGKSREHVTNMLRLLKLPETIQGMVLEGQLSMGHVRALLAVNNEQDMILLAKQAIKEKLSVRKVEALVKELNTPKKKKEPVENDSTYEHVNQRLQEKFQTKVKIDAKQIVISYHGVNDLNRILEILGCLDE
ncbi:MAG: ParB/RepB/Spo0J family partition protein [Traorella sp.]